MNTKFNRVVSTVLLSAMLLGSVAACGKKDGEVPVTSAVTTADESAAIVGAQFKLGKYVKIAPNFRISMPKAEGTENYCSAYISCYFGL